MKIFGVGDAMNTNENLTDCRQRANHGDISAMRELGCELRAEAERNYSEAFKWFIKAANFGDASAFLIVGDMCRFGQGTPRDTIKALDCYKKVANDFSVNIFERQDAVSRIAHTYENDLANGAKAVRWLKRLIRLGQPAARFKIAEIFRDGRGLAPSGEKAVYHFTHIINDETLPDGLRYSAALEVGKIFHAGKIIERNDKIALQCFKIAACADKTIAAESLIYIAEICSDETDPNVEKVKVLSAAVEAGSHRATRILSDIFRDGKFGVNQNYERALELLSKDIGNDFSIIDKIIALRKSATIYRELDPAKADELSREAERLSRDWTRNFDVLQTNA